jgi:NAD(P)-dependent dehydrogenase (short-subunit alcohol dehydrogenase family)
MKNILLIGGSYGIGQAIASQLQNSNNVFVASRTADGLQGLNVTHIPFDATTETLDISKLPAQIDGFVYCPGSINLRPFRGLKHQFLFNGQSFADRFTTTIGIGTSKYRTF